MSDTYETRCPACGQTLRVPDNIGGMVMVCPGCGQKLYSDFKLGGGTSSPGTTLKIHTGEPPSLLQRMFRYFKR